MSPGQHVRLSPSSASRWMACPGSIALLDTLPAGDTSSPYAEEGTAAHALAERAIRQNVSAGVALTQTLPIPEWWSGDMAEAVTPYVDHALTLANHPHCRFFAVEVKLTLDLFSPPEPMGGTADCVALVGERLHVVDLKYGRGVAVEVDDNPQLQYYALMALIYAETLGYAPKAVTLTVVQPRKEHVDGPVRSIDYAVSDLLAFAERLLDAAWMTQQPDAPRAAGAWCKFCEAKPICPEQQAVVRNMVAVDFDAIPESLPEPSAWSLEEIGAMLRRAEHLADYITACEKFLTARLREGQTVSTHKLVQAVTHRRWRDGAAVVDALAPLGVSRSDLYDEKLVTPAEAARRLKVLGVTMPEGLIESPPGAIVLAPVTDRRPAVGVTAANDFSS